MTSPLVPLAFNDLFGVWLGFTNHFPKECIMHYDLFVAAMGRASSPLMKSLELEIHPNSTWIVKSDAS